MCLRATGLPRDFFFSLIRSFPDLRLVTGAKVFRLQCSVCHTLDGANGLDHLTGSWQPDQLRLNIAKLQHTKPFMPPFAGNAEEVEALAQLLLWRKAGRPSLWTADPDPAVLAQITRWLDQAGTGSPVKRGR